MGRNGRRTKLGRPKGAVPLEERLRRFDAGRWPGAAVGFLRDAPIATEDALAEKYGFTDRRHVSQ